MASAGPSHAQPQAAALKRQRTSFGAVAAGASTNDILVPAVCAELQEVSHAQIQDIKKLARQQFKIQKQYNRFTALQAANKTPKTLRNQLGAKFQFRCPNPTVRETTQATCSSIIETATTTVFKEMVDGYKDAFDAAKQACDTATAAATNNLRAAFMAIKANLQHGSTDARLQQTFRHVQVDMEAEIARMLISMRDSIVGRPPPPPAPAPAPAAAAAAGPGAQAGAAEAMVEGDEGIGPLNQEAAADQQAAAAPILTKAEVEQLIAAALQQQRADASRKPKPRHSAAPRQPKPQQRHQAAPYPGRQYVVLRQPHHQGFLQKPGRQQQFRPHKAQPARQQQNPRTQHGRRQQPQQQQQQGFYQGPPGYTGYWHPDNVAVPGGQPINGHAIRRGHNGGTRSTRSGYATGGGSKPRQNRQVHFY